MGQKRDEECDRQSRYAELNRKKRAGRKDKHGKEHRWALIRYFVISLPLVTIVSQ